MTTFAKVGRSIPGLWAYMSVSIECRRALRERDQFNAERRYVEEAMQRLDEGEKLPWTPEMGEACK